MPKGRNASGNGGNSIVSWRLVTRLVAGFTVLGVGVRIMVTGENMNNLDSHAALSFPEILTGFGISVIILASIIFVGIAVTPSIIDSGNR